MKMYKKRKHTYCRLNSAQCIHTSVRSFSYINSTYTLLPLGTWAPGTREMHHMTSLHHSLSLQIYHWTFGWCTGRSDVLRIILYSHCSLQWCINGGGSVGDLRLMRLSPVRLKRFSTIRKRGIKWSHEKELSLKNKKQSHFNSNQACAM